MIVRRALLVLPGLIAMTALSGCRAEVSTGARRPHAGAGRPSQ